MPIDEDKLKEFFWSRVRKTEGNGCWEWTVRGGAKRHGYGNITMFSKERGFVNISAHRASWIIHFGPIPERMIVRHKCNNPPCVRLDHLCIGTQSENIREAFSKGRMVSGFSLWLRPPLTHCPQGHPFNEENTRWERGRKMAKPSRKCRICDRERHRTSYDITRKINKRANKIIKELQAVLRAAT